MTHDTFIDEPVKVWAFFDPTLSAGRSGSSHISPIAMQWQRRLIKFEKLIFASSLKVGDKKLVRLVCASESANFELEYNSENYLWRLKKVMPKE